MRKRSGSSLMHRGANDCLDSFNFQTARLSAIPKDGSQQLFYFAGNFLVDRLCRFFPEAAARPLQLAANGIMFINSPVKVWNLRNAAISFSALRTDASESKFRVTVLRAIFCVS